MKCTECYLHYEDSLYDKPYCHYVESPYSRAPCEQAEIDERREREEREYEELLAQLTREFEED